MLRNKLCMHCALTCESYTPVLVCMPIYKIVNQSYSQCIQRIWMCMDFSEEFSPYAEHSGHKICTIEVGLS